MRRRARAGPRSLPSTTAATWSSRLRASHPPRQKSPPELLGSFLLFFCFAVTRLLPCPSSGHIRSGLRRSDALREGACVADRLARSGQPQLTRTCASTSWPRPAAGRAPWRGRPRRPPARPCRSAPWPRRPARAHGRGLASVGGPFALQAERTARPAGACLQVLQGGFGVAAVEAGLAAAEQRLGVLGLDAKHFVALLNSLQQRPAARA
jgi:hypothetical protein